MNNETFRGLRYLLLICIVGFGLMSIIGSSGGGGGSDTNGGDPACSPGAFQSCQCSNGNSGSQVCNNSGTAWNTCDCGDNPGEGVKDSIFDFKWSDSNPEKMQIKESQTITVEGGIPPYNWFVYIGEGKNLNADYTLADGTTSDNANTLTINLNACDHVWIVVRDSEKNQVEGFIEINALCDLPGENRYSGHYTICNQDDIDSFALENYTHIDGNLYIGMGCPESNIVDLTGLEYLQEISGALVIQDNSLLVNLNGLDNLKIVGGVLLIDSNPALTDVVALNNVRSVGKRMEIKDNASLESFGGFGSFYNIESIGEYLKISSNSTLTTLQGFKKLTVVNDDFLIESNPELKNLSAFNSLKTVDGDLSISWNYVLETIKEFKNITFVQGDITVWANSPQTPDSSNNLGYAGLTTLEGFEGLTVIEGDFKIYGNDALIDLEGLNNISQFKGSLSIRANDNLSSLSAIDQKNNLFIHSLDISMNPKINSLDEFNTCLIDSVNIFSNAGLLSINGFNNQDLIAFTGGLGIQQNVRLENIYGFLNLEDIAGGLIIQLNDSLTDINFPSLTSVQTFDILSNHKLCTNTAENLEDRISISGIATIEDNKDCSAP